MINLSHLLSCSYRPCNCYSQLFHVLFKFKSAYCGSDTDCLREFPCRYPLLLV